ncbi:MAG: lysophospholipid acyltransferase family protein [Sporomusaceae bacterium]|nr:lysophospholipid acyltransferase family protein [Sporomusaceae bacterium]
MLYGLLRLLFNPLFKGLFRLKVTGRKHLPQQGGYILAANHMSNWDPPVLGTAMSVRLHFMAKLELFQIPLFGAAIRSLGAFPVKRGVADRTALRTAIDLLKEGKIVGIFPEGTRSKTGELQKPAAGLEMIAAKAEVPVVPAAIYGTNRMFKNLFCLPQLEIHFGAPIYPPKKGDRKEDVPLSEQVMASIQKMLDERAGKAS